MAVAATSATMEVLKDHSSHPDFLHLAGLVSEAVLEVVFVALPGFLVAASGMFDANSQKFVAELNTMVFTPCLIFTKLASQLDADKLGDLVVIPFIFAVQITVSWLSAQAMAHLFGFGGSGTKRQKNFILAMGVFGNSNSLPISLVISLSQTIKGLHWDAVPGDNDDEVAARGILYLLVFQQLGQLLRWTWGYSVLLKPPEAYEEDELRESGEGSRELEDGQYRDDPDDTIEPSVKPQKGTDSGFSSGSQTPGSPPTPPVEHEPSYDIVPSSPVNVDKIPNANRRSSTLTNSGGPSLAGRRRSITHITRFPSFTTGVPDSMSSGHTNVRGWRKSLYRGYHGIVRSYNRTYYRVATFAYNHFRRLPPSAQKVALSVHYYQCKFWAGVWRQMNPPLWAMLTALVVASVPKLQHALFDPGTFLSNSVSRAISQSGGVAVPLILVVLGANLARSTLPQEQLSTTPEEKAEERRLLYASLLSRMVIPTIIMAPLLALAAKYIPVSILDDPIFIIVCFLLTGAPSALQLAQICQINNVFMGAMSSLLVASYVVAIFPSTLLLVLLALEVLEWAV